jgi:hypothetical protein
MNLIQKLTALATALQEIMSLSPQVQTELTSLSNFLDTV